MNTTELCSRLRTLHRPGHPLVLVNVWDAGSAHVVQSSGAQALATSSWAVATAAGAGDGERLPFSHVLDLTRRIVAICSLPITVDMERGYARDAAELADNMAQLVSAGAVGCNIEDGVEGAEGLRPVGEQCNRLKAAHQAVAQRLPGFFINARCDAFLSPGRVQSGGLPTSVLERAHAYAEAGADGFFLPGLSDLKLIEELVRSTPLPVNIMTGRDGPTVAELAAVGVARVSFGPDPYLAAMEALTAVARTALGLPDA